jgi:hypothetical protein
MQYPYRLHRTLLRAEYRFITSELPAVSASTAVLFGQRACAPAADITSRIPYYRPATLYS